MQFRLRTLMIVMAAISGYLGLINAPSVIAMPIFYAVACTMPAYWVTGVIYAREQRRAFFIGGIAAGVAPYLQLVFTSIWMFDGRWGHNRYEFGETQAINMMISLFVFSPLLLACIGGWIGWCVYRSLQPDPPANLHSPPPPSRVTPHSLDREESRAGVP